ncbi:MAG: endonuclease/exonuclease/phosphatase family protein [Bdellovibrionaceae bacterium]|nr:endonuclease/exonuclease/phosphatase family protein [Pseudobdellovibrionaceae bacterium]
MLNQNHTVVKRVILGIVFFFFTYGFGVLAFADSSKNSCAKVFYAPGLIPLADQPFVAFMTFNLRNFGLSVQPEKFDKKALRVAQIIRDYKPDFVIFQEVVDLESLRRLAWDYLRGEYGWKLYSGAKGATHHLAFIFKRNLKLRYEFRSNLNETWVDPVTGRETTLFTRDVPIMIVWNQDSLDFHPVFIFIGVHIKSPIDRYGDLGSEILRKEQLKRIGTIITDLKKEFGDNVPIIVGGDFNIDLEKGVSWLSQIGMEEAFHSLSRRTGKIPAINRITFVNFSGNTLRVQQLDGFFIDRKSVDVVDSIQVVPFRKSEGGRTQLPRDKREWMEMPSDHYPVLLKLNTQKLLKLNSQGLLYDDFSLDASGF